MFKMVLYQFFPYDSLKGLGGKLMFSTVLIFACYSPLGGTDWSISLSLHIFLTILMKTRIICIKNQSQNL